MNSKLVIHLKDGHYFEALLASIFDRNSIQIDVIIDDSNQKHTFSLEEVCYICFPSIPLWAQTGKSISIEEVATTTGETFQVVVLNDRKFEKGFIGILTDIDAPFRTIFFSSSGVRYRSQKRRIGQIIHEQTAVSDESIRETLQRQETLRSRRVGEVVATEADIPQEVIEKTLQGVSRKGVIPRNVKIGDILIESGLVTHDQIEKALASQKAGRKVRLGELLRRSFPLTRR